jgi:hypothetical protein
MNWEGKAAAMKQTFYPNVTRQIVCLLGVALCFSIFPAAIAEAGILVSSLSLYNRVAVLTDEGNFVVDSVIGANSPVPVTGTLTNAVGDTSSLVNYSYDWSGDTGTFRVDGAQTAVHPSANLVQSLATGNLNFTPMVDSLVTLRVQYTYDLPGNYMEGFDTGGVFNLDTDELYAQISHGGFSLGPVSGSFDQTMTAIIPAGCNCEFVYTMRLTTEATSVAATDSGIVELSIVPLPETATILPLAFGVLLAHRRARRSLKRVDVSIHK